MRAGCSRGEDPGLRTHALCISDFDVFSDPTLNSQGGADEPFNSRCQMPLLVVTRVETSFAVIRSRGWSSLQEDGGARRDRTDDLMLAKHALYQLSYGPNSRRNSRGRPQLGAVIDPLSGRPRVTQRCGGPRRTRTADLTLIRRVL